MPCSFFLFLPLTALSLLTYLSLQSHLHFRQRFDKLSVFGVQFLRILPNMFWKFERRPWFQWWVFKYIASVGIGKTKWMRCLTFSDLSPGNEFAGGWRGRDQQCIELSLQLLKCCRPGLSIGPLPPLIGQKWVRKEREMVGETSAGRFSPLSSVVG